MFPVFLIVVDVPAKVTVSMVFPSTNNEKVSPDVSTLAFVWVPTVSTSVKVGVVEVNIFETTNPEVSARGEYDVFVNDIEVTAAFQLVGAAGASSKNNSLNLSIAVPIGVSGVKSVKIPSV